MGFTGDFLKMTLKNSEKLTKITTLIKLYLGE